MPRKYSAAFKFEIVRQLVSGEKNLSELCREYDLNARMVIGWRDRVKTRRVQAFPRSGGDGSDDNPAVSELAAAQARIGELERLVARQALEKESLTRVLRIAKRSAPRPDHRRKEHATG